MHDRYIKIGISTGWVRLKNVDSAAITAKLEVEDAYPKCIIANVGLLLKVLSFGIHLQNLVTYF